MKITTVGLDLAKGVFTLRGVDAHGSTVLRETVRQAKLVEVFAQLPACVVGMEACSGAQHWAWDEIGCARRCRRSLMTRRMEYPGSRARCLLTPLAS